MLLLCYDIEQSLDLYQSKMVLVCISFIGRAV